MLSFAYLHSLGLSHKKLAQIPVGAVEDFFINLSHAKLASIGIHDDHINKILEKKTFFNPAKIQETLERLAVTIVHRDDENFPSLLRMIPDCPTILYVRGSLPRNDACIAVVGSRNHSSYAENCLTKIIPDLTRAGYTIVSGGAYGIDTVAHTVAVKSRGHTVVVFGAGIDVIYPQRNAVFFEEIIGAGGALISHFPVGTLSEPFNFPIRNTLVSGMCRGTLIAEANEKGGTLITARLALEYNRDVFVIPADISRESALGSNALIRDGLGKLVINATDILNEYEIIDHQLSLLTTAKPTFTDPVQEMLYDILCLDTKSIDDLVDQTGYEAHIVINTLAMMEIDGIIVTDGGGYRVG